MVLGLQEQRGSFFSTSLITPVPNRGLVPQLKARRAMSGEMLSCGWVGDWGGPVVLALTPCSCFPPLPKTAQRKIREIVQQVKQQEQKHAQGAPASQHSK